MSRELEGGGLRVRLDHVEPLRRLALSTGDPPPPGTDGAITVSDYFRLVQRLSLRAGDEACRMSARPLAVGTTDYMVEMVRGAVDLEDAMRRVARAYNLIHGGDFNRVERRDGRLAYVVDDHAFGYTAGVRLQDSCTLVEGILIFLHTMFGLGLGRDLDTLLLRVRTRRPERTDADGLLRFWRAPVRCAAPVFALDYAAEAARLPVRPGGLEAVDDVYDAVARLAAARDGGAPDADFLDRAVDAIASGVQGQPAVARRLGVSVATLRRRLDASGASFRALRVRALDHSARALLAGGREVEQVAEILGFADARSFSRAFKAWNGETPTAWSERVRRSA